MDATELRQRLGAALRGLEAGQWRRAEAECRVVLDAHPAETQALLLLGLAVAAMGEPARAAPALDRVMRERPDYAHPCQDLASLQPPLPRGLIAAQYRACLRLAPDNIPLRRTFATFLLENDGAREAISVLQAALGTASAHNLMGMALADVGCFADAIVHFERSVELDPAPAAGWANLGLVLKVEGRFDAALAAYDKAIARAPEDAQIRVNRAVALLQAGRWTEAWVDYEWRLRMGGGDALPPDRLLPALGNVGGKWHAGAATFPRNPPARGGALAPLAPVLTDLHGLTVLAVHEEGFGDTIQFARYLPLLAGRGARVVAMVPRPLERLMRSVVGVETVLTSDAPLPAYDFHCPFFSLPRAFGTTVATIPSAPYLTAEPDLVARWGRDLPGGGLRVGLVWAGQARPWLPGFSTLDRRRSAGLSAFAPLARVEGLRLVSLQMGPAAAEVNAPPPGSTIFDPMPEVTDFADTAAIIENLDLVVSVDTSVVHLAGGMGKPVFLMDRYDNCWRWLSGRSDSPWYPNLTIFRQETPGDWSEPMNRVAAALEALVAFRGPPARGNRPSPMQALADVA